MDFVSDIGAKFVSHQVLASERGRPIRALSYGTYALGKGLDAVFGKTFEQQRIELWHALYSFVVCFLLTDLNQLWYLFYLFKNSINSLYHMEEMEKISACFCLMYDVF